MSAGAHLSVRQFQGTMSPEEMAQHWDPSLKNPEKFREWTGPAYIRNLAYDISQHGMQKPVQLMHHRSKPLMIYDGHHRVLAAMDLGLKEIPYQVVSGKPGEQ